MSKTRVLIALGCCVFALAIFSWAQALTHPGLWEMTTTMTWQKSPMPAGMTMPAGMKSPFSGTTTTMQVCLTQAMIDKYGAPVSQNRDCQTTNVVKLANSMTADLVCTGKMSGKGTVEASWTDAGHVRSKSHFAGTMGTGSNAMPVEWTTDTTSAFKGSDCGSVKPLPMPDK
jgi:hypothetical protein